MTSTPQAVTSICVYCGSRSGTTQAYVTLAAELGAALAERGIRLVYGGGDVGLMGILARATRDGGGAITGIIPAFLKDREVGIRDIDDLIVVDSMHTRKMLMFERSDAFVVLPGGIGTLDEMFEMLTWRQLNLHAKPIILLDLDGYWTPMRDMLDHMVSRGFLDANTRDAVEKVGSVAALFDRLGL